MAGVGDRGIYMQAVNSFAMISIVDSVLFHLLIINYSLASLLTSERQVRNTMHPLHLDTSYPATKKRTRTILRFIFT